MSIMTQPNNHPLGSTWNQWDLHFHTPSSFDYQDKTVSNKMLVDTLLAEQIRVVAITDHHFIDIKRIKEMQQLGGDKLTVLPGLELRSDQGGKPIHYICIFSEDCDLETIWTKLQGTLGLTQSDIQKKGGDEKVYVPLEDGAKITRELGGIVSIHAGSKTNSIEGIQNKEQFQERIKADITERWVDIMEVGQIKDIEVHLNIIFPAIGIQKPLIICSDNHDIKQYTRKVKQWLRATPGFRGLQMVLREPKERTDIGIKPEAIVTVEQNPTKYISNITFARKNSAPPEQKWFTGEINFNSGLIAVIGNKGSGKSALSDTIGLLGASKNITSFSFLHKNRFCHPRVGHASHFEATIKWHSNETLTRCLADQPKAEDVERVEYLPQDHVEKVCNELSSLNEDGFEKELKGVIFSHIPEAERLSQKSLDELVKFKNEEKQKRIDVLLAELREASRTRSYLELQADPLKKKELIEKIARQTIEIAAHTKLEPTKVEDPTISKQSSNADLDLLKELSTLEEQKAQQQKQISEVEATLKQGERSLALVTRLIEKLTNFGKTFQTFKESLQDDTKELGLDLDKLITLNFHLADCHIVEQNAKQLINDCKNKLSSDSQDNLRKHLDFTLSNISQIQAKLNASNKAFQVYRTALLAWQEKLNKLVGNADVPESLEGLKAALTKWETLPAAISKLQEKQNQLALEILDQKISQVEVYRALYASIQKFIDSHPLAKNKLHLEFRAELVNQEFQNQFLGLLALNRKGSFMGSEQGRSRIDTMTAIVNWADRNSVANFLSSVDKALHFDIRDDLNMPLQISEQLPKNKTPQDVFDFLYGLNYITPHYVLRWEGKEISMLSPGERGTLLLVFYLLIDNGDVPLIIDQPEGNLDNETVAKILVDCLREARKHRQVFIVTHNPNLAVVCDADQVVYSEIDKDNGNLVTYVSGALEDPIICKHVTDVLEGTRWAFGIRESKYEVGT